MEFSYYQESSIWREGRKKRITSFVRILSYLMIVLSLQWAIITFIQHIFLLTAATLITAVCGFYALKLIRSNKLNAAKFLILYTGISYYLIACIFASGYGTNNGSAHFGFIMLAIISYFLLHDFKITREIFLCGLLLFFFLFHFGYAPFYPLVKLPAEKTDLMHKLDISLTLFIIFFIMRQYVVEIAKSEEALANSADRLEGLLESMLPKSVAERMQREGKTFADEFHECSVLLADIAGFTTWSASHTPNEVVEGLNSIFSKFDDAVERNGLTKIKTSGDSYMVAAGIPEYRHDHAEILVTLALELQAIASKYEDFKFRIGINSGSVVAGVIGKKIFIYDLWGDTVNTASRMESSGEIGRVNISGTTYELVKDKFICVHRGKVKAKNKGEIDMYFVDGPIS